MKEEKGIAKSENLRYNFIKEGAKELVNITPKDDLIFKMLFGVNENKDLLKDFLEALLEIDISDLEIAESTELLPEEYSQKFGILDVLATLSDGTKVNIEMQNDYYKGLEARAVFYLDKIYLRDIPEGTEYKNIPKAIVIFILNDNHFRSFDNFHSKWYWTQKEEPHITLHNQEMHLIELPKFRKKAPDLNKRLSQWLAFLDYENGEWLEMAVSKNEKVKKANEELDKIKADKHQQYIQYLLEKGAMDRASLAGQYREEGELKKQIEIAKNLLDLHMSIEDISKATGLTIEEIKKLCKNGT